ncbi:replication endonuclease [Dickeya lacustris]|uniref:Replication endonuclease n=1 Tax=Dickeya lacustris TaxID=2259638 RepID=A0ABY8G8Y0_9GAMM|nr:replication endonuclease [Dickeya lacustris]WFN56365.1 replication endonuclease [Dickeya lacustris]
MQAETASAISTTDNGEVHGWAYSWNTPRLAIAGESVRLSPSMLQQGQATLYRLAKLPRFLAQHFRRRFDYLDQQRGGQAAFHYLLAVLERRLLPRVDIVMAQHQMDTARCPALLSESEYYNQLPDMPDKLLTRFAARMAMHMHDAYNASCDRYQQANPATLLGEDIQSQIYRQLAAQARALHVMPLHWQAVQRRTLTLEQAFAGIVRLVNARWWERQLKIQRSRWREALWIASGEVSRAAAPCLSRPAMLEIHTRRLATVDFLKSRELENTRNGERLDLHATMMSSIANPAIRRMELMTLLAGIEQYALQHHHIGMLITLTAPGAYHPTRTHNARQVLTNPRWQPECPTPKTTQHYLVRQWGKMRTAFKDKGLRVYGLRVVEPHHDGTPHWHLMLYCERAQRQAILDIVRRYSLGDNAPAAPTKRQFDCKHINRGGATAYVAKYVAKNLDGYALDGERDNETGKPLREIAARACAWASLWRIPQFHFIGLPGIGVYRECRRIRSRSIKEELGEQAEAVRVAADRGDFARYIEAQGGTNVSRKQQSVRIARAANGRRNPYDEPLVRTVGIIATQAGGERLFPTRPDEWRIVAKTTENDSARTSPARRPWSSVNNCGNKTESSCTFSDIVRHPSARLTYSQRDYLASLRPRLGQLGIETSRWEREALARGAQVKINGQLLDEFRNKAISAFDEKRMMTSQVMHLWVDEYH